MRSRSEKEKWIAKVDSPILSHTNFLFRTCQINQLIFISWHPISGHDHLYGNLSLMKLCAVQWTVPVTVKLWTYYTCSSTNLQQILCEFKLATSWTFPKKKDLLCLVGLGSDGGFLFLVLFRRWLRSNFECIFFIVYKNVSKKQFNIELFIKACLIYSYLYSICKNFLLGCALSKRWVLTGLSKVG